MKRLSFVAVLVFDIACSGTSGGNGAAPTTTAPSPETPESSPAAEPVLASVDEALVIPARANIFGAGKDVAPGPGGGGGGALPPGWRLPASENRIVSFPSVTGRVQFWAYNDPWNGPAGDQTRTTNVFSNEGIAGIRYEENGSFLVGVFLADRPPKQAPPRLDFSQPPPADLGPGDALPEIEGDLMNPEIGQVFYIGDGKDYRYVVPPKATRLFVGGADGRLWKGPPGYYENNRGRFRATIALTKG